MELLSCGFHGIDAGDMEDDLLVENKHFLQCVEIAPLIEVIVDSKRLEIIVAVELFVISIGELCESGFGFQ